MQTTIGVGLLRCRDLCMYNSLRYVWYIVTKIKQQQILLQRKILKNKTQKNYDDSILCSFLANRKLVEFVLINKLIDSREMFICVTNTWISGSPLR